MAPTFHLPPPAVGTFPTAPSPGPRLSSELCRSICQGVRTKHHRASEVMGQGVARTSSFATRGCGCSGEGSDAGKGGGCVKVSCFGRSDRELQKRQKSPAPKTSRFFLEISGGVDERRHSSGFAARVKSAPSGKLDRCQQSQGGGCRTRREACLRFCPISLCSWGVQAWGGGAGSVWLSAGRSTAGQSHPLLADTFPQGAVLLALVAAPIVTCTQSHPSVKHLPACSNWPRCQQE